MDVSSQKRMASEILGVGENRVWIDPEEVDEVADAITKQDIRNLIEGGTIQKKDKEGNSRGRTRKERKQKSKGRKKGHGSRKGAKGGRKSDKDEWKEKIRSLREELKEMRDEGELSSSEYRKLYNMAKGGFFRNKKHMKIYIDKKIRGE
ncbi:MAG: 50S ribosomal protein L19e [Candidatus Nanohaloarchaeota archaeon QJJ-9]|nr:50S ribosomal protein L19e [Candidatus Nanohaloarchaeota archaeon QJJ-9]